MMIKPRFNLAIRSARQLLQRAGVTHAPVNVEQLARLIGATVRYSPLEGGISGTAIRRSTGEVIIGVNSNHVRERQRFSLAHELGHAVLHRDAEFHLDDGVVIGFRSDQSSKADDPREIEANQFAAELLMPAEFVIRDFHRLHHREVDDAITELANLYGVSLQAMTIRVTKLTNVDL
jgi:Zn-dependent peptidase ImmA (M78 family)